MRPVKRSRTDEIIAKKLLRALDEEDASLYLFEHRYRSKNELIYFSDSDRRKVESSLDRMARESRRHKEMIQRILNGLGCRENRNA